jgi:type IV pilus assembly protein PilB
MVGTGLGAGEVMSGKLGEILISQGVIDEEKLVAALSDQRAFGGKLGRTLVDLGYVNEDQLMRGLSEQLGLDTVDLDSTEVADEALSCLPVDACERYGVFPVRVDRKQRVLWVATAEPDRETLQEVAQIAQLTLEPMLASMSSIDRAVRRYYFGEKMLGPKHRLGEPLRTIPATENIPLGAPAPRVVRKPGEDDSSAVLEQERLVSIAPDASAQVDGFQELKTLIVRLERTVNAQARAFRALIDLLQDKGVVRRGELGARTAKK